MAGEKRDPALDQLDALVGEWDVDATHPMLKGVTRGEATFAWLPGRAFLVQRSDMPPGDFPSSLSVIGGGTTPGTWPMHYFDSRGVMRVYQLSAESGLLKMSRDHPGFSQRATFTFEDGGRTLRVEGEANEDGEWKPDARFIYRRRAAR